MPSWKYFSECPITGFLLNNSHDTDHSTSSKLKLGSLENASPEVGVRKVEMAAPDLLLVNHIMAGQSLVEEETLKDRDS